MVIRDGRRIFLADFPGGTFRAFDTPEVSGVVAHRSGHTRRCHPRRSVLGWRRSTVSGSDSLAVLVSRAQEGDQDAWNTIVERFLPLVGAIARQHRLSPADGGRRRPDGVAAPGRAPRRPPRARGAARAGSAPRPATSACGCSPRAAGPAWSTRRRAAWTRVTDDLTDAELLAAERRQALRDALAELPEGRRELLLLLLVDPPLAYEEISRRLGIPIGSIGPTRARAFAQLRDTAVLRHLGPEPTGDRA